MLIKFDSVEKIKIWLKNISNGMKDAARDTGRMLTEASEKYAKDRVRSPTLKPGKGKGVYFGSIHFEFKAGKTYFLGSLKNGSPLAGIIEFGSRPHIIRSGNGKRLFWPGAKHPVKEVKHPGTPAFRVLGDAVEEAALHLEEKIDQAVKKQFGSFK